MASFSAFKSNIITASNTAAGVETSAGVTVYATRASLPSSGNTAGDQAYVTANNRLYIWNGSGWYNIALLNIAPSIQSVLDSDGGTTPFSLATDGTATTITITAADSDGDPITYTASADSDFSGLASLSQADNVFTITPFSSDSATTTSGTITFTATDGVNVASSGIQTFTLLYLSQYWDETVLSIGTSGLPWNLSNAVDTGTNISLSSTQEHFSSDGLTLITVNSSTQVGSHDLSTAYDMSTITASQAYNISEETTVEDARFSSDGTKMYVVGIANDTVYQYSLSTAFDVSSASYDSVSFAINGQESAPRALAFSSDGTKMYISGNSGDDINEYNLSTAWDLSTAAYSQVFSFGTYQQTPLNIEFSSDGTKLFIYGSSAGSSHPEATSGNRIIDRWDLSTAWDVSTMTYHSYLNDPIGANAFGMTFNNDGTTLYVSTTTVVNVFDMSRNTNDNFIDRSTNAHSPTVTGTGMRQTAFHPYLDNWSVEFDGTGDYLRFSPNTEFNFGNGDFTIECWFNSSVAAAGSDYHIISYGTNSNNFWAIRLRNAGDRGLEFRWYESTEQLTLNQGSDFTDTGVWHHLAVTRNGSSWRMFLDGTQVGSTVTNTGTITNFTGSLDIGALVGGYGLFNGYISNVRIVKGTALYTSNFTPATENLTAVSGTSLLTCQSNRFIDNSTNGHTITSAGDVKVSAFNPFGQGSEYAAGANEGACVFDATGNYIDYASDTSFAFGTGDYTVEWWHWQTAQQWGTVFDTSDGSNYINTLFISTSGTANETIKAYHSGGARATGTNGGAFPLYQWTHCAVTRQSGVVKIYINGKLDGQGSGNEDLTQYGATVGTATFWGNSYGLRNGSIVSDLKVTKGTAVYTTSASVGTQVFTPPTSPAGSSSASLYLPFDNPGIFDKTSNHTLTLNGDVTTSTTQTKFTDTAMYFDGNGDFVSIPDDSVFDLTGDFTIEFWMYHTSTSDGGYTAVFGGNGASSDGWNIYMQESSGNLYFWHTSFLVSATSALTVNTWHHIAVTRSGTDIKMFVDGTQVGSTATSSATLVQNSANLGTRIGYDNGANGYYEGYIEGVQVIINVAKYTANFTPPTQEQGRQYQAES